jgi:hypothetical protein
LFINPNDLATIFDVTTLVRNYSMYVIAASLATSIFMSVLTVYQCFFCGYTVYQCCQIINTTSSRTSVS